MRQSGLGSPGKSHKARRRVRLCGIVLAAAWTGVCGMGGAQTAAPVAPEAQTPAASAALQAPQAASVTATAQGGVVQGKVVAGIAGKPGGVPLPGVAVTATNTLTGRKYATATDVDGAYTMKIPRNGRYVIRVELAGFAAATAEVVLNGESPQTARVSDFGLQLASRAAAAEARETAAAGAAGGGTGGSASLLRNLQGLSLNASGGEAEDASAGGGNAGAALPTLGTLGEAGANSGAETVAVSGASGQTNGLANFSEDELRQRIQEGVERARASGQLPPGVDPTNAIVGILGGMMGGGPGGGGG
ncbi:MAG TPA: carboxypeptidase-like regulatory domain-containing protein, partial [Acidobacteriaceae bacterium]|nr:carboxypeptidase-like regulatory domain-containing protein [Acidobacteriaceae bacterium]